jgi:hypothetical protein
MVIKEIWNGRCTTPVIPAGSRAVTLSIIELVQEPFFIQGKGKILTGRKWCIHLGPKQSLLGRLYHLNSLQYR